MIATSATGTAAIGSCAMWPFLNEAQLNPKIGPAPL